MSLRAAAGSKIASGPRSRAISSVLLQKLTANPSRYILMQFQSDLTCCSGLSGVRRCSKARRWARLVVSR